nr:transposase [Nocardiopsis aegyptia]
MGRIAGRFSRVEPRRTARAHLLGLLSRTERKNCWQLAEQSWCTDPERRRVAGIPDEVRFATKPRLAWEMIAAALDSGVSPPSSRHRP